MNAFNVEAIGYLRSPYREKFGIPRQPGLVPVQAIVELNAHFGADCVRGIEQHSHLWLNFIFHQTLAQGWRELVRPPRAGGNHKLGVFATRTSFRPNALGQSVVRLLDVETDRQVRLLVSGCDLVDGTPIVDIKPYIPYADCLPEASSQFAATAPPRLRVQWSAQALIQAQQLQLSDERVNALTDILAQDPRPAYHSDSSNAREYGLWFADTNIIFQIADNCVTVVRLEYKP